MNRIPLNEYERIVAEVSCALSERQYYEKMRQNYVCERKRLFYSQEELSYTEYIRRKNEIRKRYGVD
jgi:hypothetical protein